MDLPTKYFLLFLSHLAATYTSCAATDFSITATPTVVSHYVFRGVDLGGAAFQPSIEITRNNFGAGIWTSTYFNDKTSGESDPEIDPYAYYTVKINEQLSLTPGFSLYLYPDADEAQGWYRSSFEPYLSASYLAGPFTLTPKIYYDTVLKGPTYELETAFSLPLQTPKTSLDFTFIAGTYSWKETVRGADPSVKNSGDYLQVAVSAPFQISEKTSLTFGLSYHRGFNNRYESSASDPVDNESAIGRLVFSVSFSSTF